MSYIPTNYSTNVNGALIDLGQLNNNSASVKIVPQEAYTNDAQITSFPGKTVINQSAISLSIDTTRSITGNQTYTFGPQKRGMWVAAGQGTNQLAYSYDGVNWIASSSNGGLSSYGVFIAWNGTMWVAGGKSSTTIHLAYSYNGINWTAASSNGGLTEGYYVACNETMWVAGGLGGNRLAYSYDGINWTSANSDGGLTFNCRSIAWNGIMWIAAGANGTVGEAGQPNNTKGVLAYSYDGINWSAISGEIMAYECLCVAWNGKMWVVGGQDSDADGAIAYSTDRITWTKVTSPGGLSTICWGVAWNGVMWVAGGRSTTNNITIAYSYDGSYWEPAVSFGGLAYSCRNIAWNGTMWIAIGQRTSSTGGMAYSYDGVNWMAASSNGNITMHGIGVAWNGALQHTITIPRPMVVAPVYNGTNTLMYYSYDGKTWITPTAQITKIIHGLKYNGRLWVATGTDASIYYSYDGIVWNSNTTIPSSISSTSTIYRVDANDTMWIAATDSNSILYSYNGINWDLLTLSTSLISNTYVAKWNGTMWVVGGNNGKAVYSYDGLVWNACTVPSTTNSFNVIEWNGTMWIAMSTVREAFISYDGINWKIQSTGSTSTHVAIHGSWDGTTWIFGAGDSHILLLNGITWLGKTTKIFSIKFTGSLWVYSDKTGLKYSYDGITWTNSNISYSATILGAIESTDSFPYNVSITPSVIGCGGGFTEITENGGNWKNISDANFTQIVCSSTGLFYVATGSGTNKLSYSYDLYKWTGLGSTIFSTSGNGLACNGSVWVAVGAGTNTIAYSYNGITWTGLGTSIFSTAGNSVAWNGRVWVAVGAGTNVIATSPDGITWTGRQNIVRLVTSPVEISKTPNLSGTFFTTSGNAIVWTGTQWVAFGKGTTNNVVTSSDNGVTWNYVYDSSLNDFDTAYYSDGLSDYDALGADASARKTHWFNNGYQENRVYRFSTPFGYTAATNRYTDPTNPTYGGNSIAWNGKILVAVGEGSAHTIATSPNGINWVGRGNTIFSIAGYSVVWNGKFFIATGRGTNTVAISYDGITWKGFGTTNFSDSVNPIKLSVLNNGFTLNSYGITGTQNIEINAGTYNNNMNTVNINIQGLIQR